MPFIVQSDALPLREEPVGALRIGNSRVLLELVIQPFQHGATPETIVQRNDTLALADVYAVIAYYLRHAAEVEEYLAQRESLAPELRVRWAGMQRDLGDVRSRLLAKRKA